MKYPQYFKLCLLEDNLDSLWNYPLCKGHTQGMDKLIVCVNKPPNNYGQQAINQNVATTTPLGKSGTLFLFLTILSQDLCWL
jgi:hypothetical protein